jgi:transposase-like protein
LWVFDNPLLIGGLMINATQHPNARLTPRHRRTMVDCVLVKGWTIEATAERFQVDPKTVRKWRDRFLAEGEAGLQDRSSRPRCSPNQTPRRCRRRVIHLRRKHRWGADHIAHETGLAASTVQSIPAELVALAGRDDIAVPAEDIEAWQWHTSRGFEHRMIPGKHLFIRTSERDVLRALSAVLDSAGEGGEGVGAPGSGAGPHRPTVVAPG